MKWECQLAELPKESLHSTILKDFPSEHKVSHLEFEITPIKEVLHALLHVVSDTYLKESGSRSVGV